MSPMYRLRSLMTTSGGFFLRIGREPHEIGEKDAQVALLVAQPAFDEKIDDRGVHRRVQRLLDLRFERFDRMLGLFQFGGAFPERGVGPGHFVLLGLQASIQRDQIHAGFAERQVGLVEFGLLMLEIDVEQPRGLDFLRQPFL